MQQPAAAGFEFIPHWRLDQYPLDRHIKVLFRRFKIDYVIDAGANEGQFGQMLRRDVGYRGPILSFEPLQEVARALRVKAAADGNWQVVQNALGSTGRTARSECLRVADVLVFQVARSDRTVRSVSSDHQARVCRDPAPRFIRGSRACSRLSENRHAGFDLEVIRGATGVLNRVLAVQTEVAFIPLYQDVPDWRESVDLLGELGFVVSGFYSVSHDEAGRLITGDCLLVRR